MLLNCKFTFGTTAATTAAAGGGGRGRGKGAEHAAGVWRGTAATAVRSSRWSKLGLKSGEGVAVAVASVAAAAAGVLRSGHVLRCLAC